MISCISYKYTCYLGHGQGERSPGLRGLAGLAVIAVVFWIGLPGLVPSVLIPARLLEFDCWWLLVTPLVVVIWDVFS